jgi:glycosyltransferase involved in cell wall biosynthesis
MSRRLLLVLGSSAGGTARHVGQVARLYRDAGWEVRVAGPPAVHDVVAAGPITAVDIADRPRPAADLRAVRALRALTAGADVVHAHGLRAGALAVLAARGTRVVVTLHNRPVGGRAVRAVSGVLERVVARGADVVLAVSPDLVERARSLGARRVALARVPAPAAARVPVGPDAVDALRESLGLGSRRLIVTVARLAPQKGTDTLVAAAAALADRAGRAGDGPAAGTSRRPRWLWVVAGDGPLRAGLDERLHDTALPVALPVDLLGVRDDVPTLLAAADVVVSAAVWEGQPLWLQEALAQGAAIVATDAGGTRAVVGDAAVLVPVGDAPALARAVATVLDDAQARDRLRARATARKAALPTGADVRAQLDDAYGG